MEAETVSEKLAREFMDLVNQIMANLESVMVSEAGLELPEGKTGVTRQEIQALREGLERLVEINPSPQQLLQLIEHARNALELSVDMSRTDLVFNILRKEMQTESDWQGSMKPAKARELEFGMTEDQLVSALQNLEADATRIDDPSWRSDVDHLQMCLELLGTEPNAALRHSIEDSLAALLGRPETRRESLGPISMAVMSQLQRGSAELVNPLVASVSLALRKGRPAFLGDFWMTLKSEGQAEDLTLLWPHLINDILLGLDEVDRDLRAQLLIWAGSLPPDVAPAQIPRLLEQPALEKGRCAADLFQVSLPEVHVVLRTLAATPLAAWLGRSLHAKLKARPFNKLVGSLMKVMVQYQPANLEFYLDLIAESDPRELPELLKERAVALLMGVLSDMPRSRRRERWVAVAVESLRELDCPLAGPLLDQVVSSKRLLFFPDWPEACRNAAVDSKPGTET